MLSSSPSSSSIVKAPAPPPPPASSSFSTASYRPCLTPSLSATARTWPLLPTLRAAASTLRSRSIALRLRVDSCDAGHARFPQSMHFCIVRQNGMLLNSSAYDSTEFSIVVR